MSTPNDKLRRPRWTQEENQKLLQLYNSYQHQPNWKSIADFLNRSVESCRHRYRYLVKSTGATFTIFQYSEPLSKLAVRFNFTIDEPKIGSAGVNSFWLYRRAFTPFVTRMYNVRCQKAMAKICGYSWQLEPEDIKATYKELAKAVRSTYTTTNDNSYLNIVWTGDSVDSVGKRA